MSTAPAIQGSDTLRDPRMQWQRAMNRFAAEQAVAATATAGAADDAPAPTFAERLQRVELRGGAAASAPGAGAALREPREPRTLAEQQARVPIPRVTDGTGRAITDPRGAARDAAEQMVSSMFVQPLLDMALEQAGDGPFSPGQAEKTFGPLLHQAIADQIVRKADLPLVDAMVEQTLASMPGAAQRSYLKERGDG